MFTCNLRVLRIMRCGFNLLWALSTSMLAADFVRVAIHGTKDLEASVILQKFKKRDFSYIVNAKENFLMEV